MINQSVYSYDSDVGGGSTCCLSQCTIVGDVGGGITGSLTVCVQLWVMVLRVVLQSVYSCG